jgi:hypothetical protein
VSIVDTVAPALRGNKGLAIVVITAVGSVVAAVLIVTG